MDYSTLNDIFVASLLAIMLAVPFYFVVLLPARMRQLPAWVCPLLAVFCTEAMVYGLFYCVIYPATRAYIRRQGGMVLLDYLVNFLEPWHFWLPTMIVTGLLFAIRASISIHVTRHPILREHRSPNFRPSHRHWCA
jgi:hypothetical protein